MNILFTCVGRRVALIQEFRRALADLGLKGNILATDITSSSPAFRMADKGVLVPGVGRVEYIPTMMDICRENKIRLVVPLTDLDLRSLARQREKFDEMGCTVMVGSEPSVALCRDKFKLNAALGGTGLAAIGTYTISEFRQKPFYPCFIKPVRGSASVGAGVIHNDKELGAHMATFGDLMLVQDYVPGQEFTIDVYRSRDGTVRSVVPRQRLVVRAGEVEKGLTVKDEALIEAAAKLAGSLGDMWGVFNCQCRRVGDEPPKFFEVNPRFGGGVTLSIAAGADMPKYLLQEITGRPITAKLGDFKDHMLMLRYDQAVYVELNSHDVSTLPGYSSPYFR